MIMHSGHSLVSNCVDPGNGLSGLVFRSDLVGTGKAISIVFGINGFRNKRSHLVGPPFPEFEDHFSAMARLAFLERLN